VERSRTGTKDLLHKLAAFAPLLPVIWLIALGIRHRLGANPIEKVTHWTGDSCLVLLLMTLSISPARSFLKKPDLIRLRKPLGLWAFAYGTLHLFTYLWLDKFFDWNEITKDITKRPFITAGSAAFFLMIPLAVTSTESMIRRLGKNWSRLHRLIYLSSLLGVIHYWWLVKADITLPATYGFVLAALLLTRLKPFSPAK